MNKIAVFLLMGLVFLLTACVSAQKGSATFNSQSESQQDDWYADDDNPGALEVIENSDNFIEKLNQEMEMSAGKSKKTEQAISVSAVSDTKTIEHEVWIWQESGDCLWALAKKYYGDPWLWKKIYIANQSEIADPAVIYPRQIIKIPPLDESELAQ